MLFISGYKFVKTVKVLDYGVAIIVVSYMCKVFNTIHINLRRIVILY